MNEISYFNYARDASKFSTFHKNHTGCVIVYKKHIISIGFNSSKTHPIQKIYNKERFSEDSTPHCLHAEISALIFIKDRTDIKWNNVEVYTYRENKYGEPRMAKPCKSCISMIKSLGIRKIHYTTNGGFDSETLKFQ